MRPWLIGFRDRLKSMKICMGPSHTMGANVTHYVELFSGAKLLHINKPMKMGDQEEIGVEKK